MIGNLGYANSETGRYAALLNQPSNRAVFLRWASECHGHAHDPNESCELLANRLRQNCERYAAGGQGVYEGFSLEDISRIDWDGIADRLVRRARRPRPLRWLNRYGV